MQNARKPWPSLFPSLLLTGKSTRDGFFSSPLTAPTVQGREERCLIFSPQKMPSTPHCCFRGQPSPRPYRREVLPGAGPHACLLSPHLPVLAEEKKGSLPISSPPSLSSCSQPGQAADRCTGGPWLELGTHSTHQEGALRTPFPHPSGLPPSVCGRRGLARQEEHRRELRGWWEGILRLSRHLPHTPLCPTSPSRCISHSSPLPAGRGSRRFHTSSPLHTSSLFLECSPGPCQPVEFLFIFQIQTYTSSPLELSLTL